MPTGLATTRGLLVRAPGPPGRAPEVALFHDGLLLASDVRLDPGSLSPGPVTVSAGLVLVLAGPSAGPGLSAGAVLAATSAVIGALEVSVAGSLRHLVLGPAARPPDMDLGLVGVLLEIDGVQVATAAGAAALGHPAEAAAAGLNAIGPDGLPAGALVYTGALTPPVDMDGHFQAEATFAHLGRVGLRVGRGGAWKEKP